MELSIIILNWNVAADTIRCARRIASWERLRPTIWVVDNGSTDGSADVIARECPGVCLIRNATNLGFAGGNNQGITQALSAGATSILLLNNDASVEEEDIIRLADTLQNNEQIGCVGPMLYDADNEDVLLAAGGKNPVLHHQTHILELTSGEPVRTVECVPGTVILVRADVFRTVGLLDEAYFFCTEVADLCKRAAKKGYLSAVDTRARALHALSRSSDLRGTLYTYYIIRNRFLFIRRFYGAWAVLLYGFWALYSLALSLRVRLAGDPDTACSVRLGLLDGLRGRFGGQNERVLSLCSDARGASRRRRPRQ